MTPLKELKLINDSNIVYLKKINKNYHRNEIIKNILNDDACFFKMNKNDALLILHDVGILEDQIEEVYKNLTSFDEFYRLFQQKKIDLDDKDLIIQYPIYEKDSMFEKKPPTSVVQTTEQKNSTLPIKTDNSIITKFINKIKNLFKKH